MFASVQAGQVGLAERIEAVDAVVASLAGVLVVVEGTNLAGAVVFAPVVALKVELLAAVPLTVDAAVVEMLVEHSD